MDHVSQVGLCYRADPPNRPGGTDQSILRALSDLMPVIADQSRWDDLTQVCDPSPGLRSAGHARGTRLVPEAQPSTPRVVDLVPAAWPCVQYVVRLAIFTLWYAWPCILHIRKSFHALTRKRKSYSKPSPIWRPKV